MDQVLQQLEGIGTFCAKEADRLSVSHSLPIYAPPMSALNRTYNLVCLARDALTMYDARWANPPTEDLAMFDKILRESSDKAAAIAAIEKDNASRVIETTKSMFVFAMSAFEAEAKFALAQHHNSLNVGGGRVYLKEIVNKSHGRNLITEDVRKKWHAVIDLRNILVHNNGIADEDQDVEISSGLNISHVKGKMTEGKLSFFPGLTRWAVEAYAYWSDRLLSER